MSTSLVIVKPENGKERKIAKSDFQSVLRFGNGAAKTNATY
jgi:hypothetical protein